MEDVGSTASAEDNQGPGGSPPLPVPLEGPTVPATLEPGKSWSSAHRHASRRPGLSKLCQSRMLLSGKQPLPASRRPVQDGATPVSSLGDSALTGGGRPVFLLHWSCSDS